MDDIFTRERAEFRDYVNQFVHPSQHINLPEQLKGREQTLSEIRDCFETPGMHGFIWGNRGVGKTSLAHTACGFHSDIVRYVADVACEKDSSLNSIITDIYRKFARNNKTNLPGRQKLFEISIPGIKFQTSNEPESIKIETQSVNHAASILSTLFDPTFFGGNIPTVIIDEFDRLEVQSTKRKLTDLLKQMSVDDCPVKFLFCGVSKSLNELLGSHESAERYIHEIKLDPLTQGAILEIVDQILSQFDVAIHSGQRYRISQIADGYPHFCHLILKNLLLNAFETGDFKGTIDDKLYVRSINSSIRQSAIRFKNSYELATQRNSDRYIEVLWAAAHGSFFQKQFRTLYDDYIAIISQRKSREELSEQKFRNHLNALTKINSGNVLEKVRAGWYEYTDPLFRSYVRLRAEQESIELGSHHFHR
jgi:AAA domain